MGKIRSFRKAGEMRATTGERAALPGLMPIDPNEIPDGIAGSQWLIERIAAALRRERARAGHWTYDLERHIGLRRAPDAEKARRKALVGA